MSAIVTRPAAADRERARAHTAVALYAGLWALTALATAAALVAPSLAPNRAPHPTLEPTAAAVASILLNNTRVLAPPFLLAAFGFGSARSSRALGDLIVAAPAALLTISVGIAIGCWGERLLPYIPQLPIEYAAAAAAASVWVAHRRGARPDVRSLARNAGVVLALLALAAALEVLATPHAR